MAMTVARRRRSRAADPCRRPPRRGVRQRTGCPMSIPPGRETEFVVGDLDHAGERRCGLEGVADRGHQFLIDEQQPGLGMVEDVVDLGLGQPGVQRDQHASRERHGEVRDQHLGHVRGQEHHPVTGFDAGLQRPGETLCGVGELGVGVAAGAVDDRLLGRVHLGRALQEPQRGERRIVGGGVVHGLSGLPLSNSWFLLSRCVLSRGSTSSARRKSLTCVTYIPFGAS